MKIRAVIFDVDGVLTEVDSSWGFVHRALGVYDRARDVAQRFERGEISYQEWMRLDTQLWLEATQGRMTRWELERILSGIPIRTEAQDVARCLHRMGKRIALVSGGIDLLVARVAAVVGADLWVANQLSFDREWRLIPGGLPVVGVDKARAVRRVLWELSVEPTEAMYVGDSRWDVEAMKVVGYPVALGGSREILQVARYRVNRLGEICDLVRAVEKGEA
ncbi:MAG: HAD-IB family phosphatase [Acidilobus sp.]